MTKKQLVIVWAVFLLILSGCATTLYRHSPIYLSTDESTTGIVVKFSRNMGQTGVIGHLIKVDNADEVRVEAVSELTIFLTPGTHKLRIVSISSLAKSVWYSVSRNRDQLFYFGKPVEEEIVLNENEIKTIKFTPPFIGTLRGKLQVFN
jgi:hypothetical protein